MTCTCTAILLRPTLSSLRGVSLLEDQLLQIALSVGRRCTQHTQNPHHKRSLPASSFRAASCAWMAFSRAPKSLMCSVSRCCVSAERAGACESVSACPALCRQTASASQIQSCCSPPATRLNRQELDGPQPYFSICLPRSSLSSSSRVCISSAISAARRFSACKSSRQTQCQRGAQGLFHGLIAPKEKRLQGDAAGPHGHAWAPGKIIAATDNRGCFLQNPASAEQQHADLHRSQSFVKCCAHTPTHAQAQRCRPGPWRAARRRRRWRASPPERAGCRGTRHPTRPTPLAPGAPPPPRRRSAAAPPPARRCAPTAAAPARRSAAARQTPKQPWVTYP